jgi:hypothetical protein
MKAQTEHAKLLGMLAFAKGINAPALDSEMQELLKGRKVSDQRTVKELKAWMAGWTNANLYA